MATPFAEQDDPDRVTTAPDPAVESDTEKKVKPDAAVELDHELDEPDPATNSTRVIVGDNPHREVYPDMKRPYGKGLFARHTIPDGAVFLVEYPVFTAYHRPKHLIERTTLRVRNVGHKYQKVPNEVRSELRRAFRDELEFLSPGTSIEITEDGRRRLKRFVEKYSFCYELSTDEENIEGLRRVGIYEFASRINHDWYVSLLSTLLGP